MNDVVQSEKYIHGKKSTIHAAEIRTQDLLDTSQMLLDPCQWGGSKLHKQHCLKSENHAVGIQLRPLDNAAYGKLAFRSSARGPSGLRERGSD